MDGIKYSVIIPMYNEQEVIKESYRRLDGVMRPLGEEYELIFVNDGSRDKTMEIMLEIANNDKHVKIVDFARNFGHQTAVT
ncbi:MAG: glycosyltransferase, partial [Clostridiales bacterium]|nr:glycosyltransferase [Clostridiales bacterium]